MVDRDLVSRRRLALEQYLRELREVIAVGRAGYLADWKSQRAAERSLHLAMEVCLDLAEHVIADQRLKAPETAAGMFDTLRDAQLIEPALAEALSGPPSPRSSKVGHIRHSTRRAVAQSPARIASPAAGR